MYIEQKYPLKHTLTHINLLRNGYTKWHPGTDKYTKCYIKPPPCMLSFNEHYHCDSDGESDSEYDSESDNDSDVEEVP